MIIDVSHTIDNPLSRRITKLAFISRLTDDEHMKLISKVKEDIVVEMWYQKFKLLDYVMFSDQFIKSGLQMFIEKEILTQERADEISAMPIADSERPV